ncbi:19056_t:CDS:2, partial [Dentiscutata erythropus]
MNNFIFVFILFAIFLTVNAAPFQLNKRAITFNPCPNIIDSLTVVMQPDPFFQDSGEKGSIDVPYIQTFSGLYLHGSPFSISASNVSIPIFLPHSYLIAVSVGDRTNNPMNPMNQYGCAFVNVSSAANSF